LSRLADSSCLPEKRLSRYCIPRWVSRLTISRPIGRRIPHPPALQVRRGRTFPTDSRSAELHRRARRLAPLALPRNLPHTETVLSASHPALKHARPTAYFAPPDRCLSQPPTCGCGPTCTARSKLVPRAVGRPDSRRRLTSGGTERD